MTIQLTNSQTLALRRDALPLLRKLEVKNPDDYEPHRYQWETLQLHRKEALRFANSHIDKINDEKDESKLVAHESIHDAVVKIIDGIDYELDQRSEKGSRAPREHGGSNRRPMLGNGLSVRGDGTPITDNNVLASVGLKPEQRMRDYVSDNGVEHIDLTPGAYLRAMVLGAKTEVEKRALSEGTDSAGGFTVPDILSAQVIDLVRAQSTVIASGAVTVPLQSDTQHIAKVATDPIPAWRDEAAAVAEADPTFTRVTFNPRSLAVLVKVSRELLEDSLNMETLLPRLITSAMAVELDRVSIFGTGVAPQPRGVVNFAGVEEVTHGSILDSYAPLISARTKVKSNNHAGVTSYIMHPRDEGTLAGLTATDNQPLMMPPALSDIPMLASTTVPTDEGAGTDESSIITGDFSKLMIGLRHGVTIQVLKERFQDTGQYGFVAFMRADIQAEYENAFCKITGITA